MKQENGITLVALVITIIVLVILVGVTIIVAINSGIIGQTKSVADQYKEEQINEQIQLALGASTGPDGKIDKDKLKTNLEEIEKIESANTDNFPGTITMVTKDGGKLQLDPNRTISELGDQLLVDISFTKKIASANRERTAMTLKIVDEENNVTRIPLGNDSVSTDGTYEVFYVDRGETCSYEIKIKSLEKEKTYGVIITGTSYWPYKVDVSYDGTNQVSITDEQFVAGDVNKDAVISLTDLGMLMSKKKSDDILYDFNRDGIVDDNDEEYLKRRYGLRFSKVSVDMNGDEKKNSADITYANDL